MDNKVVNEKQALEACFKDSLSFRDMLLHINNLPENGLLINGFMTAVAMLIVESYDVITELKPEKRNYFDNTSIEKLRLIRHRVKLLDSKKDFDEVLKNLKIIEENEIKKYKELTADSIFSKLSFPIKDMGITKYRGKFITTTHSSIFDFGPNFDLDNNYAYELGERIGLYLQTIIDEFDIEECTKPIKYTSSIDQYEMIDIKSDKLYKRSNFQISNSKFAPALTLILVRLNYTKLITTQFFPENDLGLLRLKFINAFHASSSLKKIQSFIMGNNPSNVEKTFFKSVFTNNDIKWLLGQKSLRNFLTHYLLDENQLKKMPSFFNRHQAIELLSKGVDCYEIEERIDRAIENIVFNIEDSFSLKTNTFWLNRVRM